MKKTEIREAKTMDLKQLRNMVKRKQWLRGQWQAVKDGISGRKYVAIDENGTEITLVFYHTTSYQKSNRLRIPSGTRNSIGVSVSWKNVGETWPEDASVKAMSFLGEGMDVDKRIRAHKTKIEQWAKDVLGIENIRWGH